MLRGQITKNLDEMKKKVDLGLITWMKYESW